jgi:signal transduction histidine kinase/ActR/RegA family two-component response regulator
MLDALGIPVALIDGRSRLLAANMAWSDLMRPRDPQAPAPEQRATSFSHCLPWFIGPPQTAQIADRIQSVLDGTLPAHQEDIHCPSGDHKHWYRIDIQPFTDQHDAVMLVCHDVTEQRKTQRSLKKSRGHLYQAQKMEALGTLVAGVAHEINNPISLMMFNLPIVRRVWQDILPLLEQMTPPITGRRLGGFSLTYLQTNFSRLIDDMDMAASRVSKIVKDLKNFSRRSYVSEKKPLQINAAVTNALRLARTTIQKSGVDLIIALADDLPCIHGNLPSIEQIILNILINAVQAIDGEQGKITIKTGLRPKDAMVFVALTDNGRGVAPSVAEKLFDPFVTDKQKSGGSGLGLAVSYSLAQAHNGSITFEAAAGGGTTFTIWLPADRAQGLTNVLVVDDDAMVRELIVQLLSESGAYQVAEAASGIDGLLRIGTSRPDLLILDLKMPGMNGLDVCRAVQRNEQLATMKVLITTGHPNHPDLDEIKAMGYTDCYIKPVRVKAFRKIVEAMTTPPATGK